MPIPTQVASFWTEFLNTTGCADEKRFYKAFFFGDSEDLANDLADLVLRGIKCATAGAAMSYQEKVMNCRTLGTLAS
jgi:uncharacterized protein YhfF